MPVRTVFSSAGIGLDNFKAAREQHLSQHASSMGMMREICLRFFDRVLVLLDGFKKRFLQSIDQSDSPIFTEDLRNMIMSANTDEEIHAVIQALRK